ncbi:peptide chain release factor N(5)-glutamine methyltransferase [Nesterenkonia lutea]|uniref:peptide chain release factor N(5)-glutamine methyltransferase n=1 Tax=Nesterenkonia lutea TaxID=272919 RepID=A0ABR9JCX4_9MICC|nr:peptide chain release factor N(5)-glutamine methyltransferase [Nesterenkonia lutea]MBE1523633.1 release factor glutamine methyltransferase [Nesterenkonia lutea]
MVQQESGAHSSPEIKHRPGGQHADVLLKTGADRLTEAGVPSPRTDAEILAAHVLGVPRGRLAAMAIAGSDVSSGDASRYLDLVEERASRVPLQHLTGLAPFRHLELRVGPGVFIPRPETEQVAQAALDQLARVAQSRPAQWRPRVIDLGTGSGALAAAIASEHPGAEVHAVELSAQAAAWAEMNLRPLGVTLHQRDLREVPADWESSFDVVVSNPPYIPAGMVPREEEVRVHDPELALYGGGADGLSMPHAVIAAAKRLLVPGGWFILEHAEVQAPVLAEHCRADAALERVATHQDLAGRDRATSAHLGEEPAPSVEEWRA